VPIIRLPFCRSLLVPLLALAVAASGGQAAAQGARDDGAIAPVRKAAPAAGSARERAPGGAARERALPQRADGRSQAARPVSGAPRRDAQARKRPDASAGVRAAARAAARPVAVASVAHRSSARMPAAAPAPARMSVAHATGLHAVDDPLDLNSAVALVADQASGEVLFAKNPDAVLPIASITKVMTAMVVLDARLPLDDVLEIGTEDIDTEKGSRSRLRPGTRLTRADMLHLALMASENRAANALGRHYPGGLESFVLAMNLKARQIGMTSSRFNDPTGLSGRNVSTARDLARMLQVAYDYPLVREYSTSPELQVPSGADKALVFRNTNRLIDQAAWSIGLQQTGYISEAGRCLVMQVGLASRSVLMVLLDATGRQARYGDAQRLRNWLDGGALPMPSARPTGTSAGGTVRTSYVSAGS
jgi:D-alanyl-D-alanine endopeptidase (penicillin-binding protein 7)